MSIFMVDKEKFTVTIHREGCSEIDADQMQKRNNKEGDALKNPIVFLENDLDLDQLTVLMNGRCWITLICESCFRNSQ